MTSRRASPPGPAMTEEGVAIATMADFRWERCDIKSIALLANVLASVAAYENEVRSERIRAGQAAARASGKRWGGSQKGRRLTVTDEQVATIRRMDEEGESKAAMARATGLSRPTVYRLLAT